jgi:hypothetical protein
MRVEESRSLTEGQGLLYFEVAVVYHCETPNHCYSGAQLADPNETPSIDKLIPEALPADDASLSDMALVQISATPSTVATTGKRQAFRQIRRELKEGDLASSGVQKLLLEELERADAECEILKGYIQRYHDADKRAAVLEEKLRAQTAFEILFGVGVGLGCGIVGLAPLFWDTSSKGPITLGVGILLVLGSTLGRLVKR